MGNILVVRFGDNDFHTSLRALGEYLLQTVGIIVVKEMHGHNELNEVLTVLFKHHLSLYQHRFDMYVDYSSKTALLEKVSNYQLNDYFNITNTALKETYEDEYDNGETLVVDFDNDEVHIV